MSVYMTEEEQIDAIKKWWKKYSNQLLIGISVILLCISAYRYWTWHQQNLVMQASNTYEQMLQAFSEHNTKSIKAYSNELINKHSKSIYADAAHLSLAKLYIDKNKLSLAEKELQAVAKDSKNAALKQVARLRLARVLTAKKSYDKALEELAMVDDNAYLSLVNELKGDVYSATGQFQMASESYRLALNENREKGSNNLFLEMKSNEIAVMNQSSNPHSKESGTA